jgi:hypothetical protein
MPTSPGRFVSGRFEPRRTSKVPELVERSTSSSGSFIQEPTGEPEGSQEGQDAAKERPDIGELNPGRNRSFDSSIPTLYVMISSEPEVKPASAWGLDLRVLSCSRLDQGLITKAVDRRFSIE